MGGVLRIHPRWYHVAMGIQHVVASRLCVPRALRRTHARWGSS